MKNRIAWHEEITEADLEWFIANAPTWKWVWAKTFADTAPHAYVMRGKDLSEKDYERAFRVSQAFGRPRKYYSRTNIELELPEISIPFGPGPIAGREVLTGFKFWPMSNRTSVSKAFNMAPIGLSYGKQDAPDTPREEGVGVTHFDTLAPDYDDRRDPEAGNTELPHYNDRTFWWRELVGDRMLGRVLDIGSGTGALLDMNLAKIKADQYVAVDPSKAMMNQLLYKHGWVRDLHVEPIGQFLSKRPERADTVVALGGSASYLTVEELGQVLGIDAGLTVLTFFNEPEKDQWFGPTGLGDEAWDVYRAVTRVPGARVIEHGNLTVVTFG